jgi:type IV fimbrial biogenesis protein FimT
MIELLRRLLVVRGLNYKGVTLIELVVTMAVFSIVLSIAAYSFKDVLWRNQVNVATNEFVTALNFARSEAVTRGQVVTVCRSLDANQADIPATPVPSCDAVGVAGWETGYIVFVDANGDGIRAANDDDLLRVFAGARGGVTMMGNVLNVANNIRYAATGFSPVNAPGTVTIGNTTKTISVVLSSNGRVRTETP